MRTHFSPAHCALTLAAVVLASPMSAQSAAAALPPLKVSANARFLVQDFGNGQTRPFFWNGDTAWNLHRLQMADIDLYLEDRAARGFNVIHGPVLDWTGLVRGPLSPNNGYGQAAYTGKNTSNPGLNADVAGAEFNDYFDQIDYIVNKAESLGMYVVLLPFWAQGINDLDDNLTEQAALREIGRELGNRYKNRTSVIWFAGGEASGESPDASVRILAEGLEEGHGGSNLTAVHASGGQSSGSKFHSDAWLDFNMLQAGHVKDKANYNIIAADYARTPVKPTFDAEYYYPDFKRTSETYRAQAIDARKGAYWSVFAGGFGHTYGHDALWQFWNGGSDPKYPSTEPSVDWKTALTEESGSQMIHLRRLMESRPFLTRIPHQGLITAGLGGTIDGSADHVQATRDGTAGTKNATYIMAYTPVANSFTMDTTFIASSTIDAWWFNPRSGQATRFLASAANPGSLAVTTPTSGPDWVLVVDDATEGYAVPGAPARPRLLVTTDIGGDPDDQQSLVRLLTYANEFDIEGLIASSRLGHGQTVRVDLIQEYVNAYGQTRANLLIHAAGYPSAQSLLDRIKAGQPVASPSALVSDSVGDGKDTEGSNWIIAMADKPDARPLDIAVWGGTADLAQALWRVRNDRSAAELAAFVGRLRVHAIVDQDSTGAWIRSNFPTLFYIKDGASTSQNATFRGMYAGGDTTMQNATWINANVKTNHGALGALYPTNTNQDGMKEGDTPSWFYFLTQGLHEPQQPGWGGWGGRYKLMAAGTNHWIDVAETLNGETQPRVTVWRWRPDFQREFQARMDWNLAAAGAANHNPIAVLNSNFTRSIVHLSTHSGNTLNLSAAASTDPDGHSLIYNWTQYVEAGTFPGAVSITGSNTSQASFVAPSVTAAQTIHIILAVKDDGIPALTSYRRLVVTVNPALTSNVAPSVSLTSPASNASYTAPSNITLTASASDSDGSVTKVEFFSGSTVLGEDTNGSDGWSLAWNNVAAGAYSLTARATDNAGAATISGVVAVNVTTPGSGGGDITTELAAHWTFNEGSGMAAGDASGNNNTGTLTNSPAWTSAGKINGALTFNGSNSYVSAASSATLNLTKDFTISAWIRPASVSLFQTIVGKVTGTNDKQYGLTVTTSGSLQFDYERGGNNFALTGGQIAANQWQNVVVTVDGARVVTLYVNNVNVASATAPAEVSATTQPVWIGRLGGTYNNSPFAGEIDDVRIYSRALSGSQIQSLYAGSAPQVSAGSPQTISLPAGASLGGSVTDDGLPNGSPAATWSKLSGPGSVSFANAAAAQTSASFSAPGNYVLRLTGSDGVRSASSDVIVTVNDTAAAWTARWFPDIPANDPRLADSADFDGDGGQNLLEYMLERNPRNFDADRGHLVDTTTSGQLTLTYTRFKNKTDITCSVVATSDITGDWSADSITETVVTEDASTQSIAAIDTPPAGATRRFIRLRVDRLEGNALSVP